MLENGSVAHFSATAKSSHMSRTSMYAPSADFSCFLNCVQNPALKLLPCRKVLVEWIVLLENGSVAHFSVTAKSPHMSRTSMYAPSADFSCFLNCVQNPALKLLPCRKVLGGGLYCWRWVIYYLK